MNWFQAGTAAIAAAVLAQAPGCEPAAPTPEECTSVRAEAVELGHMLDAAEYGGNLTAEEQAHADLLRNISIEAVLACEAPTTTTTTAPTTTSTTAPTTTTTAPTTTTTTSSSPPGIPINEALIPSPNPDASSTLDSSPGGFTRASDGTAAFRMECAASHWNFDDRILAPGAPRTSHLHLYFGNSGTNANSDFGPASTCAGGTANGSSYWVPAMVDTATGRPIQSFDDIGQHTGWVHRGSLRGNKAMDLYYKSGYQGVEASSITQWYPNGLRMIAGNSRATTPQTGSNPIFGYGCAAAASTGNAPILASIPTCSPGEVLVMTVRFPQCWDGRNLDSANHQSHMAYGLGWPNLGCPASHPVALPELSLHVRYWVNPGDNTANWRLASDTYSGPGGYSGHADVIFNWNTVITDEILNNCYRPSPALDCGINSTGSRSLL